MPKVIDREAKRQALIEAAIAVFALTGFHATKMREIADKAGVGKATIYEYFTTKEELFLAAYDHWMSAFERCIEQKLSSAEDLLSQADAVRDAAVEYYQQHAADAPILLEFWAHALRSRNPAFIERIQTTRSFLARIGSAITSELTRYGIFTPVEPQSFARLEAAISDGIFLEWVLGGQQFSLESAYKFRQAIIGVGLLSDDGRIVTGDKASDKIRRGFLPAVTEHNGQSD